MTIDISPDDHANLTTLRAIIADKCKTFERTFMKRGTAARFASMLATLDRLLLAAH